MIARHSKVSLFASVCLAVMAAGSTRALAAEELEAGGCDSANTRTVWDKTAKIRTVVRNNSSGNAFSVVISRNGTEKNKGTLNDNNSQVRYTMQVGNAKNQQIDVSVEITGHNSSVLPAERRINCNYNIKYQANPKTATWSLADGADSICSDSITVTCEDCKLQCGKTYTSSAFDPQNLWTTALTIYD